MGNYNMVRILVLVLCGFCGVGGLWGCTDAERAKFGSFGNSHSVRCFSGGQLIYDGIASGKVLSEEASDGYYFNDQKTGLLMEVSGDCVITRLED